MSEDDEDQWRIENPHIARISDWASCTSMHGVQFLVESVNPDPMKRVIWIGCVMAAWGAIYIFLQQAFIDYLSNPVMMTVDLGNEVLDEIRFPAITICNYNRIRKSISISDPNLEAFSRDSDLWNDVIKVLYTGEDIDSLETLQEKVFSSIKIVEEGLILSHMKSLYSYSVDAYDNPPDQRDKIKAQTTDFALYGGMFKLVATESPFQNGLLYVRFNGKYVYGSQIRASFKSVFGTEEGFCHHFDPIIEFNETLTDLTFDEKLELSHQSTSDIGINLGKDWRMEVLLDARTYDTGYNPEGINGFKIKAHNSREVPVMTVAYKDALVGQRTHLYATPSVTRTIETANQYHPEDRGCYLDKEFSLKKGANYTQVNCNWSGALDQVVYRCGCLPCCVDNDYFRNRLKGEPKLCLGGDLTCAHFYMSNLQNFIRVRDVNGEEKSCLSACSELNFDLEEIDDQLTLGDTFYDKAYVLCPLAFALKAQCSTPVGRNILEKSQYANLCGLLEKEFVPGLTFFELRCNPLDAPQLNAECMSDSYFKSKECQELAKQNWDHHGIKNITRFSKHVMGDEFEPTSYGYLMSGRANDFSKALMDGMELYARNNLAAFTISFKNPLIITIIRDQRTPIIWFISTLGGILGVACGMSLVSIVEAIEAFFEAFILFCQKAIRDRKRNLVIRDSPNDADLFRQILIKKLDEQR